MISTLVIAFFFSTFTLISTNMVFGSSDEFESPQTSPKHSILVLRVSDAEATRSVYRYNLGIKKVLVPFVPKTGIPLYLINQSDDAWIAEHYGKDFQTNPNLPAQIKDSPKRYLLKDCYYKFKIPAERKLILRMEFVRNDIVVKDMSDFVLEQQLVPKEGKAVALDVKVGADGKLTEDAVTEKEILEVDKGLCGK
jgi:hypothetical protein